MGHANGPFFLFLKRSWQQDKEHLRSLLTFVADSGYPLQMLFFPEGTDLSPSNQVKDRQYAQENHLTEYEYLLHPRKTGFVHCVNTLRDRHAVDAVTDVTIAYVGRITGTEKHVLNAQFPQEIHFHVTRYDITEVPQTDEALGSWLEQRWEDKERRLKQFYALTNPSFADVEPARVVRVPPRPVNVARVFLMWAFATLCFFAMLWFFPWARWYFALVCGYFFFRSKYSGDLFEVERKSWQWQSGGVSPVASTKWQ